ncbi:calcium-binding protein [Aliigemmobacter aestuarii]|uniref:Calcium-binding protein n=1 Tax=Aliigemmobacter aestuarii TaxID=1445661 RepID=A0A4S3MR59_9RHOB|nr:calcium-binding protein [Gemmobacter aestuarii]THD84594.1 calcium-binding protein [Gemmobacter aestuarii]
MLYITGYRSALVDLNADNSVLVTRTGVVGATGPVAISGTTPGNYVYTAGIVHAVRAVVISTGATNFSNTVVQVSDTGMLNGVFSGLEITGRNARVFNAGEILGGLTGVSFAGTGTGSYSSFTNHGTVYSADGSAILRGSGSTTETLRIRNTGLIEGERAALSDNDAVATEIVINRGLIVGDLRFGRGADIFEGRSGTVDGLIDLGADADIARPGREAETIQGGSGADILDFFNGAAVVVDLSNGTDGTGRAAGDVYLGFETVHGSRGGADRITGDALANTLRGFGLADTISGGNGNDRIDGGGGADLLSGGGGNDAFIYASSAEGGDRITDFAYVAGNNDIFLISASGFGAGLAPGALSAGRFRARDDNRAQDADDRFVFRTTDKTLWFDRDGNGAAAPVLIADLQPGATLTANDILLV